MGHPPLVSGATTQCVASVPPGATGTVVFTYNGGNPWTTVNVDAFGNATVSDGFLNAPIGSYTITASYSGDSHFTTASANTTFTVNSGKSTPNITLTCSPGTIASGQTSNCTAHVSGGATGTIALYEWSTYLWSLPVDDSGNAIGNATFDNLAEESPAQGIPLTATYSGDSNFNSASATTTLTVTSGTSQNYSYVYDRYGNRWQENPNGAQLAFNASTNQIAVSGYTYDAAGNLTGDGINTYSYDAEGNLTQVNGGATAKYTYNALNQRVRIDQGSTAREFVFNMNGQRTSIWDGNSGSQLQGQVYWGGLPVEFYSGGAAHFQHQDWLGTERMRTSYSGSVEGTFTSLPFGDGYSFTGTDGDVYHFAQLDKDYYGSADSQTDHAQFRQYSDAQGRWMSPDPYDGSYDFSSPQSFNRYSYVLNNPMSFVDPLGLDTQCTTNPDWTITCIISIPVTNGPPAAPSCQAGSCIFEIGAGSAMGSGYVPPCNGSNKGNCTNGPVKNISVKGGGAPNKTLGTCRVGSTPSHSQYASAFGSVAAMTAQFFSGLGPINNTFGSGSAVSQVMAQSPGVQDAINGYNIFGKTSGNYNFGVSGAFAAGNNIVAQFVGGYSYSISPTSGGINLSLSNYTSFRSLAADIGPSWARPYPMGTTHQTYNLFVPCP
jgi:RHS repeat-associated protein